FYTEPIDKIEHTESEWIIDVEPQVGVEGSKHTECTVCHTVLSTDTIDALPEPTDESESEFESDSESDSEVASESDDKPNNDVDDGCSGAISGYGIGGMGVILLLACTAIALHKRKENR
ncbi:MAG: hypothetical protein J6N93_08280, partial [Clostridia bacterium]|nr:hypothetical protein [Clostridia bacterium]